MSLDNYKFALPPTEAHLTALGKVVVESAVLEYVLELAIWQLMKVSQETGEQITSRTKLGQRVDLLLSLIPILFPKKHDRQEFAIIQQELRTLVGIRNHLTHAHWGYGVRQDSRITLNYRNEKGDIIPRHKAWRPDEIERIAARISRLGDELIFFLEARGVSTPPLPSRPWKRYYVPPEPKWPNT